MKKNRTYIITGATGFLGQKLVRALVIAGDNVVLFVRGKTGVSSRSRVESLFNFDEEELKRVRVVDCDIEKMDVARDNADFKSIVDLNIDGIWHLAANLSFRSKDKKSVHNVNFIGTQQIAKLAKELSTRLFYVSTAYVHGQRGGILKEDELICAKFNNAYEESKFMTEEYLKAEKKNGLQYLIFRPAILIDVDDVSSLHIPFGYYSILQLMYDLVLSLRTFINTHKIFSRIMGLRIDSRGVVHSCYLPFVTTDTSLNLVPVDIAIVAMLRIASHRDLQGETFHIVSPKALSMRQIAEITFDELKMKTPIVVLPSIAMNFVFSSIYFLSKLVGGVVGLSKKIHQYGYYMTKTYHFDTIQTEQAFGEDEYRNLFSNTSEDLRRAAKIFIRNHASLVKNLHD